MNHRQRIGHTDPYQGVPSQSLQFARFQPSQFHHPLIIELHAFLVPA